MLEMTDIQKIADNITTWLVPNSTSLLEIKQYQGNEYMIYDTNAKMLSKDSLYQMSMTEITKLISIHPFYDIVALNHTADRLHGFAVEVFGSGTVENTKFENDVVVTQVKAGDDNLRVFQSYIESTNGTDYDIQLHINKFNENYYFINFLDVKNNQTLLLENVPEVQVKNPGPESTLVDHLLYVDVSNLTNLYTDDVKKCTTYNNFTYGTDSWKRNCIFIW